MVLSSPIFNFIFVLISKAKNLMLTLVSRLHRKSSVYQLISISLTYTVEEKKVLFED